MLSPTRRDATFPSEPLAVVGMACRLPGADNLESFWELLATGGSGIVEMPDDRLDRRLYFSEIRGQQSKTYSSISGMIPPRADDPPSNFRSMDFEQLCWDPCHEILCGVVDEARANAGWSSERLSGSRTGVYVGNSSGSSLGGELVIGSMIPEVAAKLAQIFDFQRLPEPERHEILSELVAGIQNQRPTRTMGRPKLEAQYAAQLVAQRFQLDGPQLVIDAACASSLIALALASAALTLGEVDHAVVASASFSKTDSLVLFSQAESCSSKGSRPFDAEADGLVGSEGSVVILLKTLARARFDGDTIQAVIRGIGISSDGRGRSLWAPRKEGQLEAVRRAYGGSVTPQSVQYLEAHATSTQVGDATELEALGEFFDDATGNVKIPRGKIPLGSVKSNIGHTLESAGLAGLVKSVLCMQRGLIPPTINLSAPNPTIDWNKNPFAPVESLIPWPDRENQPRRAAVNAFGIGGLNAHVVIDGPLDPQTASSARRRHLIQKSHPNRQQTTGHRPPDDSRSMAIIGRGLVVPGAFDLTSFRDLLTSGKAQLTSPPSDRWQDTVFWETRPAIQKAYEAARAGFIQGYRYDWRRHHIPPLQIEQGNPLQFMLLDAAQQALDESGYENRPFDRSRAAVVVGTLFGGDFSHQLQVGLRLPEIVDDLTRSLRRRNWSETEIQKACSAVELELTSVYPAIKDKTGSFTCSTQASRIAKTLNVMGGAMAVDSGDCSSLAALQSAQHLLASGIVDSVFCAAAQRDLDASAFEAWNLQTMESGDWTSDRKGACPGEGVVVLLLRRLADARRDGDAIFGIIHEVRATSYKSPPSLASTDVDSEPIAGSHRGSAIRSPRTSPLTQQFGHLQSASGLLEILGATVENEIHPRMVGTAVIQTKTEMCEYQAVCEMPDRPMPPQKLEISIKGESHATGRVSLDITSSSTNTSILTSGAETETVRPSAAVSTDTYIFRIWGTDESELLQRLELMISSAESRERGFAGAVFPGHVRYRLAVVASRHDLVQKLQIAVDFLEQRSTSNRMQEQGIFYSGQPVDEKPRMAIIFPGQGSQRTAMLSDLISTSVAARKLLERADQALTRRGLPRCSTWITGEETLAEDDLQATQIAMLAANVCAFEAVREWGLTPDYFVGHSFGEYAALVAAGSLELESAIAITLARAQAVAACANGDGAMLSMAASQKEIRPLLASRTDVFISHLNAPRQTIVAGTSVGVESLAAELKSLGIAALRIPVSSPFHTPLLREAQRDLRLVLDQHRWRPPSVPLLSSVTGRFVADRDEMIDNLTRQLIEPLNWVSQIERLLAEDVRLFIEVGPGRVLTKISQQIIGDRNAFVVSIDGPTITVRERKLRIRAAIEAVGLGWNGIDEESTPLIKARVTDSRRTRESHSQPSVGLAPLESYAARIPIVTPIVADPVENAAPHEAGNEDSLSQFLIEVIVEQTGYPPEVIELDWDLEADLGIDSIRRAQILGELREYFDIKSLKEGVPFSELRTVRDILNLLRKSSGKSDWLKSIPARTESAEIPQSGGKPDSSKNVNASGVPKSPNRNNVASPFGQHDARRESEAKRTDEFLIDFVVERTGYPRDVVDLDAELEADLGIDSIVKAQLIGEVRDHFQLPMANVSHRASLAEIRTLRDVRSMIELALVSIPEDAEVAAVSTELRPVEWKPEVSRIEIASRDLATLGPSSAGRVNTIPLDSAASLAFERGQSWGRRHRKMVQHQLFDFADKFMDQGTIAKRLYETSDQPAMPWIEEAELHGVASGANVLPENLLPIRDRLAFLYSTSDQTAASEEHTPIDPTDGDRNRPISIHENADAASSVSQSLPITRRFRLEMSPPQSRPWQGNPPEFAGGAIVVGNNPDCDELARRLQSFGVTVFLLRELGTREQAVARLEEIWKTTPSPHLFVLSSRDKEAVTTFDEAQWKGRRESGITSLYWLCQRWLALVEHSNLLEDASLIGVTALGGDFGTVNPIESAESGAVTGLFKSIIIECWMNGFRAVPIKLLDLPTAASHSSVADAICSELTEPSYDVEIGWDGDRRSVLRSVPEPLQADLKPVLRPTGHWIITGGARGITSYLVNCMGRRYPEVHFHLIGTAPFPDLSDDARQLAQTDPASLRAKVMRQARKEERSPLKAWQVTEKAIEIDRSLSEFRQAGIRVTYHSCDVANRLELSGVLDGIRRECGPISGVVHGAGIGKDASFQRKDPVMVDRCLSAKLDGVLNLMSLTQSDPIQGFVAFGSISGRFGANGHTDYSLANDMLAKLVRWHRQIRPDVPASVFHWHAWDDIGMAMKPETRLALKMIGMQLMPAKEGAAHFLVELEAGLPISEVLITDTRYFRMFYPADRIVETSIGINESRDISTTGPLIHATEGDGKEGLWVSHAVLNPVSDPFLTEHCLKGRPLLPMVIMMELLAEGVSIVQKGRRPTGLRDLEIATSMKFPTDTPCEVKIACTRLPDGSVGAELVSDFHSRSGKLVSSNRLLAKALIDFEETQSDQELGERLDRAMLKTLDWQSVNYPVQGSDFYVGAPLRCLRKYALDPEKKCIWGRISAPSFGELAGPQRDVTFWLTPSAVFDAMLFTSGILAWNCVRPGVALPQRFEQIEFHRLPRLAEVCWVRSQIVSQDATTATFDMTLWGKDECPLMVVKNYIAAWLPS